MPEGVIEAEYLNKGKIAAFLKNCEFLKGKMPFFFNLRDNYYCLTVMLESKVNGEWKTMLEICGFLDKDILAALNPVLMDIKIDLDKYLGKIMRLNETMIEKEVDELELKGIPDESLRDWPA